MGKNDDSKAVKDKEWQQRELIRWLKVRASDIDVNFEIFEQAITQDLHHTTSGEDPLSWLDIDACDAYLRNNCSKERAKEIYESEDLHQIRDRVQMLSLMRDPRKFFYSVEQLITILPKFMDHLVENRKSIVETGYPQSRFSSAIWLDWRLSDLYRTKIPLGVKVQVCPEHISKYTYSWVSVKQNHPMNPRQNHGSPLALNMPPGYQLLTGRKDVAFGEGPPFSMPETVMKPSKKYTEELAEYEDNLRDTEPCRRWQDDLFDHEPPVYPPVAYTDSPFMDGITGADASRIESMRERLFDIRMGVLNRLCNALPKCDVETLMKSCLEPLKKGITVSQYKLLNKLDYPEFLHHYTSYLQPHFRDIGPIAGGLDSLLEVVQSCMCEVKLNANEMTQKKLGRFFSVDNDGTKRAHFVSDWLTNDEKKVIDRSEALYSSVMQNDKSLNGMLSKAIAEWIEKDAIEIVPIRIAGSTGSRNKMAKEFLKGPALREPAGGDQRALLANLDRPPRKGENVFAYRGEQWVMFYQDKLSPPLKNRLGYKYLSILLAAPRREYTCRELEQIVNGVHCEPVKVKVDIDFLKTATVGYSTQQLVKGSSLAQMKRRVAELRKEIEQAEADDDPSRAETANLELSAILKFFIGGRSKDIPDAQSERIRKSVEKAIREAIRAINKHHPPLYAHLKHFIHTGNTCIYTPEPLVKWTTT